MANSYNNRLEIYRGDSKTLFVSVTDSNNAQMDLNGYSAGFYAKKLPIYRNSPLDISVGHTSIDASEGAITFVLSSSDTDLALGDYQYDVIIDNSTGGLRYTVVEDKLSILESLRS